MKGVIVKTHVHHKQDACNTVQCALQFHQPLKFLKHHIPLIISAIFVSQVLLFKGECY